MFALQKDEPDDYADSGVIISLTLFTTREKAVEYLDSIKATQHRWSSGNYYCLSSGHRVEYTILDLTECVDSGKFFQQEI